MKIASIRDRHIRIFELMRKAATQQQMPDMTDLWRRFPQVDTDSGRFLEEDR